ncbi:MAG TPA: hypothetical protein VK927_02580 [Adhaeribacter sp.]|nr:hypothetical protein [Adhaeribacter sp.]
MKKIFQLLLNPLLFFCLALTLQAQAPQIRLKGEKILVNNQLYGYLVKHSSAWANDYSVHSTRDEELVYAKAINKEMANGHDYMYYEITFKGYQQKAEMDLETEFGRKLAFEMAGYNMIKNDLLNPESVEKFLARFPPKISRRLASDL